MEFLYEAIVGAFLTRNNQFACPQYSIKSEGDKAWRCPDFVVLDFKEKRVVVAEVSTTWDLTDFVKKAVELYDEGRERVRLQLRRSVKAFPSIGEWPMEIHLFVREDRKDDLLKIIGSQHLQFKVFTLEHAFRRWKWDAD